MTILDALQNDHDEMKALLSRILETEGAKERGTLFAEFKTKMTAHSRAEEKVFQSARASLTSLDRLSIQ